MDPSLAVFGAAAAIDIQFLLPSNVIRRTASLLLSAIYKYLSIGSIERPKGLLKRIPSPLVPDTETPLWPLTLP